MNSIFLLTEGTWGQIITGATTIILAIIGYLKIKGEVKEVKTTVGVVKEGQDKMKENQDEMNKKINGHMTEQIKTTAELNQLIGEKVGRKDLVIEQKAAAKETESADKIKDLEHEKKLQESTKKIEENTKKTAENTEKPTGPVSE